MFDDNAPDPRRGMYPKDPRQAFGYDYELVELETPLERRLTRLMYAAVLWAVLVVPVTLMLAAYHDSAAGAVVAAALSLLLPLMATGAALPRLWTSPARFAMTPAPTAVGRAKRHGAHLFVGATLWGMLTFSGPVATWQLVIYGRWTENRLDFGYADRGLLELAETIGGVASLLMVLAFPVAVALSIAYDRRALARDDA